MALKELYKSIQFYYVFIQSAEVTFKTPDGKSYNYPYKI